MLLLLAAAEDGLGLFFSLILDPAEAGLDPAEPGLGSVGSPGSCLEVPGTGVVFSLSLLENKQEFIKKIICLSYPINECLLFLSLRVPTSPFPLQNLIQV